MTKVQTSQWRLPHVNNTSAAAVGGSVGGAVGFAPLQRQR
jgi:hypothetical protein